MKYESLIHAYRSDILECVHFGMIAGVDFSGNLVYKLGDADTVCYLRSCSKGIQCLPVFMHDYEKRFGITEEESALFAASHYGQPWHIQGLCSIMEKLGIAEDMLIPKPTYPLDPEVTRDMIARGMPKRRIYHNCAGKHLGMITMSLGMGLDPNDYWKTESRLQHIIKDILGKVADYPADQIGIGVDGCGVPSYALPLNKCARAFATLFAPEHLDDARLVSAIAHVVHLMHAYPRMIEGEGTITTALLRDPNIIAKEGAEGMYCFALKKERLAFAVKLSDGSHRMLCPVIAGILRDIGYDNPKLFTELERIVSPLVVNDNELVVGHIEPAFHLTRLGDAK